MDNIETSSSTPLQTWFFSGAILQKPKNIEQVTEIKELISSFQNLILDLLKLTLLHKTFKVARLTISNRIVLDYTNTKLLATNIQKKD